LSWEHAVFFINAVVFSFLMLESRYVLRIIIILFCCCFFSLRLYIQRGIHKTINFLLVIYVLLLNYIWHTTIWFCANDCSYLRCFESVSWAIIGVRNPLNTLHILYNIFPCIEVFNYDVMTRRQRKTWQRPPVLDTALFPRWHSHNISGPSSEK